MNQVHPAKPTTTASSVIKYDKRRLFFRKKYVQCCLASSLCLLVLPILIFFIRLVLFIINLESQNIKNDLKIHDFYFVDVCDTQNTLIKLNFSQTWNSTFDMHLFQGFGIELKEERNNKIFKLELISVEGKKLRDDETSNNIIGGKTPYLKLPQILPTLNYLKYSLP
jgi:hypothetical protein